MKLSFIVSAYDRPLALKLCLLSLILQTEQDWECIVTDNALESQGNRIIVDEINDSRIRYVNTRVADCYYASELVIPEANGDWLCFPSDDSYYVPQFAAKMLAAGEMGTGCDICSGSRGPLDMVCCDFIWGRDNTWTWCQAGPRMCCIDKTTFIIRREKIIPWPDKQPESIDSDGRLAEEMVRRGANIGRVGECLVCHN